MLEDLAQRGWIDDRRFALDYARYRAGTRRYGRHRIVRELRARGVADELVADALAEVGLVEEDERALVRQRIARRLAGRRRPYAEKLLRSVYASLLRAGFSSAIIRTELFVRARSAGVEELEFEEDKEA